MAQESADNDAHRKPAGVCLYAALRTCDAALTACAGCQDLMKQDPLSGHLFLFRNRNRDPLKIVYRDRDGLAIWYKRLEKGTWQFPTDLNPSKQNEPTAGVEISVEELSLLLGGIDLRSAEKRRRWKRPNKPR